MNQDRKAAVAIMRIDDSLGRAGKFRTSVQYGLDVSVKTELVITEVN